MKLRPTFLFLAVISYGVRLPAAPQDRKPPAPSQWCYAASARLEVRAKPADRKEPILTLGQGALAPGFDTKQAGKRAWIRVQAVDPARMRSVTGWVDSTQIEFVPAREFPPDDDVRKLLGGAYLDDFTAAHTTVARYLLRQSGKDPVLLCYVGGGALPQTRLQVFLPSDGKFSPGPYIEFPFAEIVSPIVDLEVRDLLGDGNECFITHEPFGMSLGSSGVNMVIRRIETDTIQILWKAPLEERNLASFPPKMQILQPPESNIGNPGTVTKGEVEFRASGPQTELVWKGKVEFHAWGREEPIESIPFEKTCTWDGKKYATLK